MEQHNILDVTQPKLMPSNEDIISVINVRGKYIFTNKAFYFKDKNFVYWMSDVRLVYFNDKELTYCETHGNIKEPHVKALNKDSSIIMTYWSDDVVLLSFMIAMLGSKQ